MTAGTDALKNAFRDYQTAGVPATGPNEPDKGEIRGGFDVLGGDIGAVQSSITSVGNRVDAIETSQSAGSLAFQTKLQMDAVTDQPDNTRATVYEDGTASNNGDYRWTGSTWQYLGADRIGKVEAATGAPLSMFRLPIIYDPWGLYSSGARTVYIPRQIYARLGSNALNGSYGTASSVFSGHVALTISGDNPAVVYLDLDDASNPQKITNWTTLPSASRPDKIIVLAEIFQYRIKTPHPVVSVENPDKEHISFRWPLIVDGDKVMVPPFYHYNPTTLFTFYTPSDGSTYWELDLNTSQTSEWRYYFDRVAAAAGQTPVKVANGGAVRPLAADNDGIVIEFGVSVNRNFKSDHTVVGIAGHGSVDNMLIHGDDPLLAPPYDATATTTADITDSALLALGFAKGFGGNRPMPRVSLPEGTPKTGWVFARIYQEAHPDGSFTAPTVYVQDSRGGNLVQFATVMEKKLSDKAAIFTREAPYSLSESPSMMTIGVVQGETTPVIHAGAQMYCGAKGHPYIMRGDYGRKVYPDLLYPAKHFSVAGRKLPFFRQNMIPDRAGSEGVTAYKSGDNLTGDPFYQEFGEGTHLDYDEAGSSFGIMVSGGQGNPGRRVYRSSTANIRASGSMSGAFNVLCIGDSNTNREVPARLKGKLTEMGFTPTMVGTMANEGGENGEGRGSWEYDDFYGADSQFPAVPIGDEAAYLALSAANGANPGRWANNPFLRPSTGGDNPAHVFNSLIFDIGSYLSRFSVASPKYIPILLGTNDLNLNSPATAVAQIQLGLEIIISSIRSALPAAYVGVGLLPLPRSVTSDPTWTTGYSQAIRAILQYVTDLNTTYVEALPVWAHMSPNVGWSTAIKQTLAGRNIAETSDDLHPINLNRSLLAECIAAWIACKETGA